MRRPVGIPALLALAATLVGVGDAQAARRRFAWLWDTETLPERSTELEWWVWERTGEARPYSYFAMSGVIGLTDTVELALPVEATLRADGQGLFVNYGLDLRFRLLSPDPAKAGPVVPLLHVGVRRLLQSDGVRLEADTVVSFELGHGLCAVLDLGVQALTGSERVYATAGAGLGYAVTDELRLGVEAYGEATVAAPSLDERWITAGPSLAFTHGRFWVTASLPIGLHAAAPDFLPRVVWGVAF